MSFTFRRMTRGWSTGIPYSRGRNGIRTREYGSRAHTYHSESVSRSASTAVTDGAGATGDSTGMTVTYFITTICTFPGATRFTTGTLITEGEARGASQQTCSAERAATAGDLTNVPAKRPGLSIAHRKPGDIRSLEARAAFAPALSAATAM